VRWTDRGETSENNLLTENVGHAALWLREFKIEGYPGDAPTVLTRDVLPQYLIRNLKWPTS